MCGVPELETAREECEPTMLVESTVVICQVWADRVAADANRQRRRSGAVVVIEWQYDTTQTTFWAKYAVLRMRETRAKAGRNGLGA
jgi:hypothetical protein